MLASITKNNYKLYIIQFKGNSDILTVKYSNRVVHGSKTTTGKPFLCNDPHLSFSAPSIWYMNHLKSQNFNTIGVSLPGNHKLFYFLIF